jgi:peptidoglycan/LPS O-acetylase OafA/YrhL
VLKITYTIWGHSFWVLITVGWAASIGLAAAIYYAIERPAGRLRKRLSSHPTEPPQRAPSTASPPVANRAAET